MAAYIIIHVDIRNMEIYKRYMVHTPRIIHQFGGKFIVRGGKVETLEGEEEKLRLVIIEFPSMEQARAFYHSGEYQAVKKLREGGGPAQFVAVEGYPESTWASVLLDSQKLGL